MIRAPGTSARRQKRPRKIVNGQGGGIGLELGDLGDGYSLSGIDLDTCRQEEGILEEWAADSASYLR
jgi:hypothetical protein